MKIIIGNDHASPDMKKELVKYLEELGHEVINFGVDTTESSAQKSAVQSQPEKRTAGY